jgi:ATP-binding cassette, subfamily B, bacterial
LIRTEWHMSLYLLGMIPAIFLMAISLRNLARKVTRTGMRAMATVNATIKETISGISVAKNFRQEAEIYREFVQANHTSYRVNVRRGLVLSLVFPGLNLISALVTALLVYTGGLSVTQGLVTAGAWYLFIISLDRFMYPIMDVSSFWTQIQTGLSAAERIFALIDAESVIIQSDSKSISHLKGRIDFEHVHFQYKENEPVLEDFTLTVHPGENLAIVGHTGAGKSSIARLIARFYEFQSGKILIDQQDIRTLNLEDYRRKLGIITQVPFLFSDTIINNIRYSTPNISDEEIGIIARQIGKGEWIDTLPEGLNTNVGERGARLSMGQRQLVALMRVLVQKPSIFILDEATASVDPFTEWQIQQALNLILSRTTSILIAHRLSTVKSADRIIVVEKGKILEEGNHDLLLAGGGDYARLYNTYFRHQSLDYIENARSYMAR